MIVFKPAAGILMVCVGETGLCHSWDGGQAEAGRLGGEVKRVGCRELVVKGCGSRWCQYRAAAGACVFVEVVVVK